MDTGRLDTSLTRMTPDEIQDGLQFVDVCVQAGNMTRSEAAEWRRSMLARQAFLQLGMTRPVD